MKKEYNFAKAVKNTYIKQIAKDTVDYTAISKRKNEPFVSFEKALKHLSHK